MKLSDVRELYNVDAYREALQIDQHRLDDMLMQQPVIQQTISELAAEVASMRDAAKERLTRVDAQVAKMLRNRIMIEEGKVSEARVDREVPLTKEHKDAHHVYNELCALAAQWDALKDTARNRAFVIRDLVSLYTSNFFTDTSFRSQSNPQSVQQLAYHEARSALAEGRKARRSLAGVTSDPELRAAVDEAPSEDADLDSGDPAGTADRVTETARRSARSTTRKNAKKAAAQSVDTPETSGDTTPQDTDTKEDAPKATGRKRASSTRAALREKVRRRSGARVLEAGDDEGATGASALAETDTAADETGVDSPRSGHVDEDASAEAGDGETPPRRRRRYARQRVAG